MASGSMVNMVIANLIPYLLAKLRLRLFIQTGGHLCLGGAHAGGADLCGVVPVRHAVD